MLLAELVRTSNTVGGTAARSVKIAALAEFLRTLTDLELTIAVSYLSGDVPQGKLGIGYAALSSAKAPASAESRLSLLDVDACFAELATLRGKGANVARLRGLTELLAKATHDEQDFLRRLVVGELRQGALQGVMADALASAYRLPLQSVRRAAMFEGNLARIAATAQREGEAGLLGIGVQLLKPVAPMLADSASDVDEALATLGRAILEYKLDGVRVQVHKQAARVKVFTRNLNEVSARLPELVEWVGGLAPDTLILDGELLSLRPDGRPQPFQVTMQRFGRRNAAEGKDGSVKEAALQSLRPFFFDLLYADGEAYFDLPLIERTRLLSSLIPSDQRVPQLVTDDVSAGRDFFRAALAAGHEGLMAKSLEGPYEAGRRGSQWLKVKPAHTLDLVVLAAEWGSGRRKGYLSNLHLAARDPDGGWVMLGKTFKGMTDELLAWQTKALLERAVRREQHVVYVRPELVVEIAFDGVQVSRQYPGGVALRFARVRGYRPDKSPEQADTIETVRALGAST
jgi:DNA ligase-1